MNSSWCCWQSRLCAGGVQQHARLFEGDKDRVQVGGQAAAAGDSARSDPADGGRPLCSCPTSIPRARRPIRPIARNARARADPAKRERYCRRRRTRASSAPATQRWLVVKGEPTPVWHVVKDFWQETGFIVNIENPDAGVMETDWAENRAKIPDGVHPQLPRQGARQRVFRPSRARQIPHPARARRRARHDRDLYQPSRHGRSLYSSSADRGPDAVAAAAAGSRPRSRNAAPPDGAFRRAGRSAPRPKSPRRRRRPRATLLKGQDGAGTLSVNDQFDRAWRRVGLALDRVGFTVEDRDRSKGLYFVRYVDPDTDNKTRSPRAFFRKLKFLGSEQRKARAASSIASRSRMPTA